MGCRIVLERVADRVSVTGNCDVDDGGDAASQCAKLMPFSYHSS